MNDEQTKEDRLTLELLDAIERRSDLSQRHLARHMGVALGLANSYLKRCVRKGYVKISEAPANRYLYYVTPKGFAEKTRLTARFLSSSLAFYRESGDSCRVVFERCLEQGWTRVVLCGMSDLCEIALLRAMEQDLEVTGVFDPGTDRGRFFSRPVWRDWQQAAGFDAYIITDTQHPDVMLGMVRAALEDDSRVLVPDVLRLAAGAASVERDQQRSRA